MPFRGFWAAEVPSSPALERALAALRDSGADLKVVPPENLHVTLKFLGHVEDALAPALAEAGEGAVRGVAPFAMRLRGTGTFPERGAPRVYWAGLEGAEPLATIAGRIEASMEPLGFERESRPFRAHVTLARARSSGGADRARAALAAVELDEPVAVERIVLMRSELSRAGPAYSVVSPFALGA